MIDHFVVVRSIAWPVNDSEAWGDLVSIQNNKASLLRKWSCSMLASLHSDEKSREAYIKQCHLQPRLHSWARGPFLERPSNLTGPVSYFEIKFSRKVCCVLTSNEAHFFLWLIPLLYHFQNFWNSHLEWKTKQLDGPGNYRELRETGPRSLKEF